MDEKINSKISDLRKCAKLSTDKDIMIFEQLLSELVQVINKDVSSKIMDVFNDDCENFEVMFGVIHFIERLPRDIYVKLVLSKISEGINKYPYWLERIVNRIFNHPDYLKVFIDNMMFVPKKDLDSLLNLIKNESPHHIKLIEKLQKIDNKIN